MTDAVDVLVVDDEEEIAEFVADVVEMNDLSVGHVSNPDEFLGALHSGIKLVILDLRMPKIDGLHLIPPIAELNPIPAVILMSGVGDTEINEARAKVEAAGVRVAGTLNKPFFAADLEVLLAEIGLISAD